jgi:uncharacterized phage protein (TIGR01671 family)
MSRLFKFRVWDRSSQAMYPVIALHMMDGAITLVHAHRGVEPLVFLDQSKVDVMQWTGRIDRAGREIYEGDIVDVDPFGRTIIFWSTDADCWMTQLRTDNPELGSLPSDQLEVVGNIWANPELLADG